MSIRRNQRRIVLLASSSVLAALGLAAIPAAADAPPEDTQAQDAHALSIVDLDDPALLYRVIADRYDRLSEYEDVAHITRITADGARETARTESDVACVISSDGAFKVHTARSRLSDRFNFSLPIRTSPDIDDAAHAYQRFLAPHLSLLVPSIHDEDDDTNAAVQTPAAEPMTAMRSSAVEIEDRSFVRLDLARGHDHSAGKRSRVSLYVNPDSLLVERYVGEEEGPDGVVECTTVDITPTRTRTDRRIEGHEDTVSLLFGPEDVHAVADGEKNARSESDFRHETDSGSSGRGITPPTGSRGVQQNGIWD